MDCGVPGSVSMQATAVCSTTPSNSVSIATATTVPAIVAAYGDEAVALLLSVSIRLLAATRKTQTMVSSVTAAYTGPPTRTNNVSASSILSCPCSSASKICLGQFLARPQRAFACQTRTSVAVWADI
eukprot:scaffold1328_cov394-Prasinococcus_capsulatus_cf.AAC.11